MKYVIGSLLIALDITKRSLNAVADFLTGWESRSHDEQDGISRPSHESGQKRRHF